MLARQLLYSQAKVEVSSSRWELDMKMGRFLSTLLAVMMTAACAWGQYSGPNAGPGEGQPSNGDQPQTDVARVSMIHGDISMQRADTGDWSAATLNTPLVRGDQVSTGEKSRAEIQLDYANILRLSSTSQVKIADLTRTHIQLQVSQGYVNFSTFKGSEADTEID